METVYITQKNAVLHRCANHLILRMKGQKVGTIPLAEVKTIVLMPGIQLTSCAVDVLLEKNIDVIFTTQSGKVKGNLNSVAGGGAIVRLAQHSAFVDQERRLAIAKSIVYSKVKNQEALLLKNRRHHQDQGLEENCAAMETHLAKLENMTTLDEAMGIEGICARIYWDSFRHLLKEPLFERREYRPAPDILNSALNLGYSFLSTEISTCLAAKKFDLEIGFLHSIHYGRNSLTLDVMEAFRSPFVDAWLLTLFNKRMLNSTHFQGEEEGFYLNAQGFAKFCELYHKHLEEENWRARFRTEAANLKTALTESVEYEAFLYE